MRNDLIFLNRYKFSVEGVRALLGMYIAYARAKIAYRNNEEIVVMDAIREGERLEASCKRRKLETLLFISFLNYYFKAEHALSSGDPYAAAGYYGEVLRFLELSGISGVYPAPVEQKRGMLNKLHEEIFSQCKSDLKKRFPGCVIKWMDDDSKRFFRILFRLPSIPKNTSHFTIWENMALRWIEKSILDREEKILQVDFRPVSGVTKILKKLINAIHTQIRDDKKKEEDKARQASKKTQLPSLMERPSLNIVSQPFFLPCITQSKAVLATKKKEKVKTRGVGYPAGPQRNMVPVLPKQLIGTDFGFHTAKPITPIYCSQGAEKRRRTPFFVYHEKIEGLPDQDVVSRFREMLNPYYEGIRAVGLYNEAGPKFMGGLFSGDLSKDNFLRFKGKGAHMGGWRIHCPLKEIVENDEGRQRYLFRMGRAVRK